MSKQLFLSAFWLAVVSMSLLSSCGESMNNTVATSANGYEYVHHIQKDGAKPQIGEYAYFQIEIFVDDSLLQSSRDNIKDTPLVQIPTADKAKAQPNPVVDILPLMAIGDSITVSEYLDSFPQRPQGFDDFEKIIYRISLIDIKSEEDYKAFAAIEQEARKEKALVVQARLDDVAAFSSQTLADYTGGKLNGQLVETASGLKYIIHEEGTGATPESGELIDVHYYGVLEDGTMFDNSFTKGEFISFAVGRGQVIPGWDEGLSILKKGTKATLFIPYELAYREAGSPPVIPAKANLVFYVELLEKEG